MPDAILDRMTRASKTQKLPRAKRILIAREMLHKSVAWFRERK
jgi:hypothetical protein